MNDTCKYADILLPVAVTQEREQVELLGPSDGLLCSQKSWRTREKQRMI